MKEKVILAYSGGLDTSVIVKWVKETYNAEVICYCADVGQQEELDGLEAKAIATGASKCIIDDLNEEFARDFIFPMNSSMSKSRDSFSFTFETQSPSSISSPAPGVSVTSALNGAVTDAGRPMPGNVRPYLKTRLSFACVVEGAEAECFRQ